MERAEDREDDQTDKDEVEMRHEIVAVLRLPIERRRSVTYTR